MRIAICDDSAETLETLKHICKDLMFEDVVTFTSGDSLLQYPDLSDINLLFLDVEMPGNSGIQIKETIEKISPSIFIVFCTSHPETMQDAFGRNVISFIQKPFSKSSIELCIKKAAYYTHEYLPIKISDDITVTCRDILYISSEQKYSVIYTTDRKSHLSRTPLKDWLHKLSDFNFALVSRSAIINLIHFDLIKDKYAVLDGDIYVNISRRQMPQFRKDYDEYIEHKIRFELK